MRCRPFRNCRLLTIAVTAGSDTDDASITTINVMPTNDSPILVPTPAGTLADASEDQGSSAAVPSGSVGQLVSTLISASNTTDPDGAGLINGARLGFALLVLLPMLWTDAWRLTDRRQRMLIDAAGVMAEMMLAVIAALAWCVLPDGPARTAAFMLAGSTWLVSLAINASPLMRFDGYYFLSDLLNEPNLQPRSFALARWWLRETLFGFGAPVPEVLPPGRRRLLITYAFACWLYRFFLFLGIALLVYHLVFKLLGMILLCVELGWFLARPIALELRSWAMGLYRRVTRRGAPCCSREGCWPRWRGPGTAPCRRPVCWHAGREMAVLTPQAGRLVRVAAEGTAVVPGEVLIVLDNPDITYDIATARAEIEGLRQRITGQAFDAASAQDLPVAWQQLGSDFARLAEAETRATQMTVRAPFAGRLVDEPRDLGPGTWLPRREPIGRLVDPASHEAVAMVDEADIARIHPGVRRGTIRITVGRRSLLARWWRRVAAVVVREAGL